MDEHDPLIERLRGLGRRPVEPSVAARHLGAMAGVPVRTQRFVRLKVGTAFFAGLMLGGTGLAYADELPASVQDAAHGALSQVGLSVPNGHGHGPARYNGPECTGGPYANHGQYVRSHKSDPNAGRSRCGKPVQAGTGDGTETPETPETPDNNQGDTPGHGHGHGNKGNQGNNGNEPNTPSTTPPTAPAAPSQQTPSTTAAPTKPTTPSTPSTTIAPSSTSTPSTSSTTSPTTIAT